MFSISGEMSSHLTSYHRRIVIVDSQKLKKGKEGVTSSGMNLISGFMKLRNLVHTPLRWDGHVDMTIT
jgi:hypothetical protein